MVASKYQSIVKIYKPAGYSLIERKLQATHGFAEFAREITCEPIVDRETLFWFLHECGHVRLGHLTKAQNVPYHKRPDWEVEFEANIFARDAMRGFGVPVPRKCICLAKELLRKDIRAAKKAGKEVPGRIRRWAHA